MIWLLDVPLVVGLLWLGWRTVTSPELFRAIVWFIAMGLFMALCWARLDAPDIALAEAAIGAGLTGALLLETYRALQPAARDPMTPGRRLAIPLTLASTALAGVLVWTFAGLPQTAAALSAQVYARLDASGVSNPVTAVLLNFRAYDTLLEVAVLLLALLGAWVVHNNADTATPAPWLRDSLVVAALVRLLTPPAVLVAMYLLWVGSKAPGGAFQAGAVLAAVGVLLHLTQRLRPLPATPPLQLGLVALGLTVFTLIGLTTLVLGDGLLTYPSGWAGALILTIETALTLSIALTLVLLLSDAPGLRRERP